MTELMSAEQAREIRERAGDWYGLPQIENEEVALLAFSAEQYAIRLAAVRDRASALGESELAASKMPERSRTERIAHKAAANAYAGVAALLAQAEGRAMSSTAIDRWSAGAVGESTV